MNAKHKEKWEKTRQKGQARFILGGMFLYGFVVTFVSLLADYGFQFFFRDPPNYLHESRDPIGKIVVRMFAGAVVGLYSFHSLWNENEEAFFQDAEGK